MNLPSHKYGLILSHNEHKKYGQSIADYLASDADKIDWQNEESRQRCIDTDEIWELNWLPSNPDTSFNIGAPTLDEVLSFARSIELANPKVAVCSLFESEGVYRWIRNDGVFVSPPFSVRKAADIYGERMPLIPDEEWASLATE